MLVPDLFSADLTIGNSLTRTLRARKSIYADCVLETLPDKGLAHHHIRLSGTGVIARIPKQSQLNLSAPDNLRYQAAGFERASRGGHVPALIDILLPDTNLPRGALLVQEIIGATPCLPANLADISRAMASFHALSLPPDAQRRPLRDSADPLQDMLDEITGQAVFLAQISLSPVSRHEIQQALQSLERRCQSRARPQKRLISFDTHPGNFLIAANGQAVLVDLEKARYSYPSFDLAHATLYTSTTWDVDTCAELTHDQIVSVYTAWEAAVNDDMAREYRGWHGPLRLAMWLWSITWCAKWQVLSQRESTGLGRAEDWSYQLSPRSLIAHVRGRVGHYLSTDIVHRVFAECQVLEKTL